MLVYLIICPISSNRTSDGKYLHGTYKQTCCVIDIVNRDLRGFNFNINNASLAKGNKINGTKEILRSISILRKFSGVNLRACLRVLL